jgi:hypothetical protein
MKIEYCKLMSALMKKCYVSVLISVVKLSFNRNEYRLILCQQQRQNKWCKRSIG